MAGTIEHQWNGTVLTITSDSGTSSCDLKGDKGDDGIRGPQGSPGTTPELTGYATETYVNNSIAAIPPVDLSGYATKVKYRPQTTRHKRMLMNPSPQSRQLT